LVSEALAPRRPSC